MRDISTTTKTIEVFFKNRFAAGLLPLLSVLANDYIYQGRLSFMKWFLRKESFDELMSVKADFIVSCGSSSAAVNYFLARDQQAKSISVLKPGILRYGCFDLR